MEDTRRTFNVSSHIDTLLSNVTETPDLAAALLEALTKHIHSKINALRQRIRIFESKWKMTFEEFKEFSARIQAGTPVGNPHSCEVESDFKVWEQAVTLLKHYESLQTW